MQKTAETHHTIHDLLRERWSPRAYSSRPVEPEKLLSLFEAARWSPSGGNRQPWSFIIVTHEQPEIHHQVIAAMTGQNPNWAGNAPVLMLAVAQMMPDRPAAAKFSYYDVGQAVAHLSVQAAALGLHVHQMGGFDAQKLRALLHIPDDYEILTLTAIGYFGQLDDLSPELQQRELAPRTRKPLSEFVFEGQWGHPLTVSDPERTQEAPAVAATAVETQLARAVSLPVETQESPAAPV